MDVGFDFKQFGRVVKGHHIVRTVYAHDPDAEAAAPAHARLRQERDDVGEVFLTLSIGSRQPGEGIAQCRDFDQVDRIVGQAGIVYLGWSEAERLVSNVHKIKAGQLGGNPGQKLGRGGRTSLDGHGLPQRADGAIGQGRFALIGEIGLQDVQDLLTGKRVTQFGQFPQAGQGLSLPYVAHFDVAHYRAIGVEQHPARVGTAAFGTSQKSQVAALAVENVKEVFEDQRFHHPVAGNNEYLFFAAQRSQYAYALSGSVAGAQLLGLVSKDNTLVHAAHSLDDLS